MKRMILVVSIIFISLFISSCKKEEKEVFIDGPFEIGFSWPVNFGLTEFNLPSFAVSSEKQRYGVNEKIKFNIYVSQRLFNNAGTPTEINSFRKTEYQYDSGEYLAFSKIEIRFLLAKNNLSSPENEFEYLTDFIDITNNTEFFVDFENQPPIDYVGLLSHIDGIAYIRSIQKINPIGVDFDRPLTTNNQLFLGVEEKLTLSEEFINSPIYGKENLTFSPSLPGVGLNNSTFHIILDELFLIYFESDFSYLISRNNLF